MQDNSPRVAAGEPLAWLDTVKILELVSHDINNMAHAALSYIDLALDPKMDEATRKRFLTLSHEIVRRASHFSPNLLAMVEARDAPLATEVSGTLTSDLEAAVVKRHGRFPEAPFKVNRTGDAWSAHVRGGKYVTLCLYHLVDNAAKFHKPGQRLEVAVDATREGDLIRITVTDRGRGFSSGQEAYAAARFSEVGRVSGAGLGLATVRLVASRCGGSLELHTVAEPRGAQVTLRLPEAR